MVKTSFLRQVDWQIRVSGATELVKVGSSGYQIKASGETVIQGVFNSKGTSGPCEFVQGTNTLQGGIAESKSSDDLTGDQDNGSGLTTYEIVAIVVGCTIITAVGLLTLQGMRSLKNKF